MHFVQAVAFPTKIGLKSRQKNTNTSPTRAFNTKRTDQGTRLVHEERCDWKGSFDLLEKTLESCLCVALNTTKKC